MTEKRTLSISSRAMRFTGLLLAFITCTSGTLLLPNLPLPTNSSDFTPDATVDQNTSSLSTVTAASYPKCQPRYFGFNLEPESCLQAWEKMPRTYTMQTYAQRRLNVPDAVGLPLRYTSDDAACSIDIGFKGDSRDTDRTSDGSIAATTAQLIEKCVTERGFGGVVSAFSK